MTDPRTIRTAPPHSPDLVIIGAGLSAAILALRLAHLPRPPRVLIVEASELPFGDKTWSLQQTDIPEDDDQWLRCAIAMRWPRQTVRFADLHRDLETGYASLTSASVRAAVGRVATIRTGVRATAIGPDRVRLDDGTTLGATCVIDARGHRADPAMALAYQKFVGLTVETAAPHGVAHPVIMDATVAQIDGFRFVYLLPFSATRLLIEDTRYADGPELDDGHIEACIRTYAAAQGWTVADVVHREAGVLPIALDFDRRRFWAAAGDVPRLGMRAGLFHATTGYSLPDAVRAANLVAKAWPVRSAALADLIHDHARARAPMQAFYRFLNRMLFRAAPPERRHLVMQKFYRLPRPTIERFYAGQTTPMDILRILSGRPPVPIHRALRCIAPAGATEVVQ